MTEENGWHSKEVGTRARGPGQACVGKAHQEVPTERSCETVPFIASAWELATPANHYRGLIICTRNFNNGQKWGKDE